MSENKTVPEKSTTELSTKELSTKELSTKELWQSAMRDADIVRQSILVAALVICIAICIFILLWAQQPGYRPLVQDIRLADAVKVADVLDQNRIGYYTDIQSHMIYVLEDHNVSARIALARAGIEIDYPNRVNQPSLYEVCEKALPSDKKAKELLPLWEQPWAMRALRLIMGGLIIITLILAIVRPMLRQLIYPDDVEE